MSDLSNQLRQPSGHASLDDERSRAADELDRLRAVLANDAEINPCGHARHWTAYKDPTDRQSETYCVFCEMERLRLLLQEWQDTGDEIMAAATGKPGPLSDSDVIGELDALRATLAEIESLASWHCDPDADPLDESPADQTAHVNGLIVRLCEKARTP